MVIAAVMNGHVRCVMNLVVRADVARAGYPHTAPVGLIDFAVVVDVIVVRHIVSVRQGCSVSTVDENAAFAHAFDLIREGDIVIPLYIDARLRAVGNQARFHTVAASVERNCVTPGSFEFKPRKAEMVRIADVQQTICRNRQRHPRGR
ncbi:hypothetical protein SDC9_161654 [bioreactor metagenome]|uniref:Uncharacterized protein n=1 Tax=bioreactor metagenome TaxID=1076179 RepID=A0A645FIV3_9ZZZZ